MGGCASKPKEFDVSRDLVPSEAPTGSNQAEPQEPVAQMSQNEAPLVHISKPKEEGETAIETKAADVEVVLTEAIEDVTAKPKEEEKAEATLETTGEDNKVQVEVVEETQKTPKEGEVETHKEGEVEANKTEDLDVTPASKDKSDAPLVTL